MKGAFKLKEESYRVLPEKSLAVAVAGMGRFSEVVQKKKKKKELRSQRSWQLNFDCFHCTSLCANIETFRAFQ